MAPMRRKSQGSIRSPHVKRNIHSQVNLEGWLFKLEGGALKQWKQRWCVLVDFCLFFYKAPREEKVTSSILLPSYKINPCSLDDKISKKFAFKAEHQNMKTYYFAAVDKESMKKWMNAMSLASIMQKFVSSETFCDDDEDSGFTSYRSRRHPSNRSSSVHNTSTGCEPLKQRSNSCGDRVGEMYLGSDDKYPNLYKSIPNQLCNSSSQQEAPGKQPLYANAPPKPRRLTQMDGFALYPGDCYDGNEPDLVLESSQYNFDIPCESRYMDQENTIQYLPVDSDANMSAAMHSTSSHFDDVFTPHLSTSGDDVDVHKVKPPRPRSADFLEREGECISPSYTSKFSQNFQPQRPKSSLECYVRDMNCEEYDFDDYREAVRAQADNLYANKNYIKNKNISDSRMPPESAMRPDRVSACYVNQSSYMTSDSMLPCLPQTHIKEEYDGQFSPNSQYRSYYDSQSNKPGSNESMQRLLEWKQRMLQSPLSRRNHLQSTSSDVSSVNSSKQSYGVQRSKHHEMYQQNSYMHRPVDKKLSYQDPPLDRIQNLEPSDKPKKPDPSPYCNVSNNLGLSHQAIVAEAPEKTVSDNYYENNNVMYCVDSENNEILFSYDTSPTRTTIPTAFHGSHYPPQMHSFSTLPNVNDIGIESTTSVQHSQPVRSRYHRHEMNKIRKDPHFSGTERETVYTSDDEDDVIEDCNLKKTSLKEIMIETEVHSDEKHFDQRYYSSSPDYVNIGAMYRDFDSGSTTQRMYSSDSVFRHSVEVNKAVLKQLDQVSKNSDSVHEINPPSSAIVLPSIAVKQYLSDNFNSQSDSCEKDCTEPKYQIKQDSYRTTDFIDEMECDIKREDYYRASQKFYSSMRMKNKLCVSPHKSARLGSTVFENAIQYTPDKPKTKPTKNLAYIDKDIGLPLPMNKHVSLKTSLSKRESEISSKEGNTNNELMCNMVDKDLLGESLPTVIDDTVLMRKDEEINKNELPVERDSSKAEIKKNLTYEEMRGLLLRKREAPPPNIVQERIKKFEKVKKVEENKIIKPSLSHSKLMESDLHANKYANRSFSKRNRQKANRARTHKRTLHSDSEAIPFDESDASSDDLTMKSAPILLSPLSSVLADLRKTADSGREKSNHSAKDYIPDLTVLKATGTHLKESSKIFLENSEKCVSRHNSPCDASNDFFQNSEDSVYLPMYGIKAIMEPEYVTMSGSKSSSKALTSVKQKSKYTEEHVYNEPFSPPPSFLHDVYGKQKSKQFQYQLDSSSSDESLTENIYEKPMQRFPFENSRNSKDDTYKSVQETNFVLMNSLSCSNVTTFGQSDNAENRPTFTSMHGKKSKPHHYEQMHLSVSVPDLLQLQEIKDSDASDADDEASRDFDTAGCMPLASYQSTILDHFHHADGKHLIPPDDSSKCDSESMSSNSRQSYFGSFKMSSSSLQEKENLPLIKCMPSYETVSTLNSSADTLSVFESKGDVSKSDMSDGERKIHVRKLRVYTKGKKPEAPKICPVPFNLEESDLNKTTEKKSMKSFSPEGLSENMHESSKPSLSDNVAYVSREELSSKNDSIVHSDSPAHTPSYAPDIISSIKEDERASPFSKSLNSAPYYYSDLYSGHGINFSGQLPLFKQYEMPFNEKTSPPRSSTSLLNNIRPKSPCTNKSDIGRKVNNISIEMREKQTYSDKPVLNCLKGDETKNNLRHSIDVFQVSESKYLDAEKNKYEAGSTLEKTRPSHTISYFKHRASTPDLNMCQYQSSEHVYENLLFQCRRVSQSLEEIPSVVDTALRTQTSPVYENIEFFSKREAPLHSENSLNFPENDNLQKRDSPKNFGNGNSLMLPDHRNYDNNFSRPPPNVLNQEFRKPISQSEDPEIDFLDQDVLRRVSQQHFYTKGMRNKLHSDKAADALKDKPDACKFTQSSPNTQGSSSYKINSNSETSASTDELNCQVHDSDSTSDATSSCDEASIDSDYRLRGPSGKVSYDDRYDSTSGPELTTKEAKHLKKLVQQSHGLMCKGKQLSVSAGDLLGKTHEELVLLLIQLRRNQCKIFKAKEKLESKLKVEKDGILQIGGQHTSSQYEELCKQILHLEKQYEVTQPLVNLVDNMVKLGSLYGSSNRRSFSLPILDCSGEEAPSSPNASVVSQQTSILSNLLNEETDLQKHINEINNLEKGLQTETNSITSLHQDKEMLEHTLCGMRNKILDHQDRPAELQKLRKQQRMIEKELVRVKRLLSTSAKKIEDAASKNDQMEQEILHLRQILQQALKAGSTEMKSSHHNRADLEAELSRLQSVLDELANHRHEINNTVEKLKSEACSTRSKGAEVRASPTGVAGSAPLPLRKKQHSQYLETDLDTMITRDLALSYERDLDDIPVYANAEEITLSNEDANSNEVTHDNLKISSSQGEGTDPEFCSMQDINNADERMKRFYGILPKEKPSEIKTVRIVKRQSERRSRERDKKKVTYDEHSSVWVMEEPDISSDDYLEVDEGNNKKTPSTQINRPSSINLSITSGSRQLSSQSAHERLFGSSTTHKQGSLPKEHATKKSKRRHYTVSGYQYMLDPQFSHYFTERPRSRDDVDMERCLRTANTPDIVRSTIKKKEIFDDDLIERELGLPQKIEIPERYVEIEPEQLSATEKLQRSLKAENICKMLSETTTSYGDVVEKRSDSPEALHKKLSEEKRKRAQLLSLNQALAREVVERSKAVAVFATLERMMKKPLTPVEEDLSPMAPLPITQQRYNFLT